MNKHQMLPEKRPKGIFSSVILKNFNKMRNHWNLRVPQSIPLNKKKIASTHLLRRICGTLKCAKQEADTKR